MFYERVWPEKFEAFTKLYEYFDKLHTTFHNGAEGAQFIEAEDQKISEFKNYILPTFKKYEGKFQILRKGGFGATETLESLGSKYFNELTSSVSDDNIKQIIRALTLSLEIQVYESMVREGVEIPKLNAIKEAHK